MRHADETAKTACMKIIVSQIRGRRRPRVVFMAAILLVVLQATTSEAVPMRADLNIDYNKRILCTAYHLQLFTQISPGTMMDPPGCVASNNFRGSTNGSSSQCGRQ
jgi:hypothetical protein